MVRTGQSVGRSFVGGLPKRRNAGTLMAFLLAAAFAFAGCGASVRSTLLRPDAGFTQYRKVVMYLANPTGGGGVTMSTAQLGSVGVAHVMPGDPQAVHALRAMQFELMARGFAFVDSPADADALLDFSIGQIRYDPITGWVADEAVLGFRDARSGNTIALFRAKGRLVTPTVNSLVSRLARSVANTMGGATWRTR